MDKILRLLVCVTLLSFAELSFGKSKQKPFFFVQLTDMQMGFISANQNCDEEISLYTKTVRFINKVKPDFVVITGDFVNNRSDTIQINVFKKITSLINKNIPVFMVPGNHDMGQTPTEKNIEFYFRYYENDRFNFIHKNIQFIGINSCYINSGNENEEIQFHWLKENLESNPQNLRRIVFTHHPFFIRDINEKDSYSNIPLHKRRSYVDLFVNNKVRAIFSGHYHNNAESSYKSVDMITTSAVGKQLGQTKSGFRIVKIYPDSLSHEYIEISNLPKKIKL